MEAILKNVEFTVTSLKIVGVLLGLFAVTYFLHMRKTKKISITSWKSLIALSSVSALLNTGLIVLLGKNAFIITPLFIIIVIALWFMKRLPAWEKRHLVFYVTSFTLLSILFFIVVAGFFFHLAVEGKI
jgi:hypothetical protein